MSNALVLHQFSRYHPIFLRTITPVINLFLDIDHASPSNSFNIWVLSISITKAWLFWRTTVRTEST